MSLSRRALFGGFGAGASAPDVALITARGREELVDELGELAGEASVVALPQEDTIRISSNENPLGPSENSLAAIKDAFNEAGRYPSNSTPNMRDLTNALAEKFGTESRNVVLGAGSGEILKNAAHAFTNSDKHLVTGSPSYNQPARVARFVGAEVEAIPVTDEGKLDLRGMARAASGAGLIFVCNPNNPTSTVHSADAIERFVEAVHGVSPDTVIHFDEAYHEYVTDPNYESAVGLALETPNVFVTRTFSKCYGMAGMRVGYGVGHSETMRKLARYSLTFNTNTPGVGAAFSALQERTFVAKEQERNTAARQFTVDFFERAGFTPMDSQTNFIFVDLGRPAAEFRSACAEHGVRVGRNFPPMEQTHSRISIGTMDEMHRATQVFGQVLGVSSNQRRGQ